MSISLNQILALVGKLDDSPAEDAPRERFRRYLKENVSEVGQIRDYVDECLRTSGDQYNRALQDLVNHLGTFLGFEVEFGRYQGVRGEVGFDGYWKSPTDFHVVVEVKTTEVYAISTSALLGYINDLISERRVPSQEKALGLYVVGRPNPELRQVENSIVAEGRTQQLRIVSVESLLSLAETLTEYDITHEDILAVIRPSGASVDPVVNLMSRLVGTTEPRVAEEEAAPTPRGETVYWLTPVRSDEEETAEQVVTRLVQQENIYAWGERTPGRKQLKAGDWMCFYACGTGVIGHAKVTSAPEKRLHPRVRDPDRYPWVFSMDSPALYLERPVVIDAGLRAQMDAFGQRDPNRSWAWFVQSTRRVSKHDFMALTRQQG